MFFFQTKFVNLQPSLILNPFEHIFLLNSFLTLFQSLLLVSVTLMQLQGKILAVSQTKLL